MYRFNYVLGGLTANHASDRAKRRRSLTKLSMNELGVEDNRPWAQVYLKTFYQLLTHFCRRLRSLQIRPDRLLPNIEMWTPFKRPLSNLIVPKIWNVLIAQVFEH